MEPDGAVLELRKFSRRVKWAVVLVCSFLFVGGIHLSGLDMSRLDNSSRTFSKKSHVCVRSESLVVSPEGPGSFEICMEWIDLNDPSGRTHVLDPQDIDVIVGPEGEIRIMEKRRINFRLLGLILYLSVLIFAGKKIQNSIVDHRIKKVEARHLDRESGL